MALAETGQLRGLCRYLPVRLLIVLHDFLLECEKSMFRTASNHRSLRFLSSQVIRAVAALLEWFPAGDCRNVWLRASHLASQHGMWVLRQPRGIAFLAALLKVLQRSW